jgi:hypothetical protein
MGDPAQRRTRPARLRPSQARSKERILTQPEPAKVERTAEAVVLTAEAVVLKEGNVFLLADERGDVPWRRTPSGFSSATAASSTATPCASSGGR